MNLYGYVVNDPVNGIDANGKQIATPLPPWALGPFIGGDIGGPVGAAAGLCIGIALATWSNDSSGDAYEDETGGDCDEQYAIDGATCRNLRTATKRALCWQSAMERYAACNNGQPLPPLQGWW